MPAAFTAPRATFRRHASPFGFVGARRESPSLLDGVGRIGLRTAASVSVVPACRPLSVE